MGSAHPTVNVVCWGWFRRVIAAVIIFHSAGACHPAAAVNQYNSLPIALGALPWILRLLPWFVQSCLLGNLLIGSLIFTFGGSIKRRSFSASRYTLSQICNFKYFLARFRKVNLLKCKYWPEIRLKGECTPKCDS